MNKNKKIQTNLNKWIYFSEKKEVFHAENEEIYLDISARIIIKPRLYIE